MGTAPNTRAAVSQKNKIYGYTVGGAKIQQLGAISEFGFDESRTIDPVRGVGFGDQIAELVPSVTDPMTLTINKTLLYTANLFQILGYKGGIDGLVRSLRHHRWPFDVKQELVFSELVLQQDLSSAGGEVQVATVTEGPDTPIAKPRALMTYFEGCWMQAYNASFTSDAAIVLENSTITVTDIIDGTSKYGEFIDADTLAPIEDNGGPGHGYSLRFASGSNRAVSNL
jgi:hypothetical protein